MFYEITELIDHIPVFLFYKNEDIIQRMSKSHFLDQAVLINLPVKLNFPTVQRKPA